MWCLCDEATSPNSRWNQREEGASNSCSVPLQGLEPAPQQDSVSRKATSDLPADLRVR